jgi:hypothetical protein
MRHYQSIEVLTKEETLQETTSLPGIKNTRRNAKNTRRRIRRVLHSAKMTRRRHGRRRIFAGCISSDTRQSLFAGCRKKAHGREKWNSVCSRPNGTFSSPCACSCHTAKSMEGPRHRFSSPSTVETLTRQRPKKTRHHFCLRRVFFITYTANKKGRHVIAICLPGVTCYWTRQSPMGRLRQSLFAGYRGLGTAKYLHRVFFPGTHGKGIFAGCFFLRYPA